MTHAEKLAELLATLASYGCSDIELQDSDAGTGNVWLRIYDTDEIDVAEMIDKDILKPAGFDSGMYGAGATFILKGFERTGGCAFHGRLLSKRERVKRKAQTLNDRASLLNSIGKPIEADGLNDLASLAWEEYFDLPAEAY